MKNALFALAAVILFPLASAADVYSYTDAEGNVHYVDRASKVPEEYREQAEMKSRSMRSISKVSGATYKKKEVKADTAEGETEGESSPTVARQTPEKRSGGVEVFVGKSCASCDRLEDFLKRMNIRYKRYDVDRNARGAKKLRELGGGTPPVTRVGDKVINGYDPDMILTELGMNR